MGSVNPHTLKFLPWAFFKQALSRSEKKQAASRINGAKGGRPRKVG